MPQPRRSANGRRQSLKFLCCPPALDYLYGDRRPSKHTVNMAMIIEG